MLIASFSLLRYRKSNERKKINTTVDVKFSENVNVKPAKLTGLSYN